MAALGSFSVQKFGLWKDVCIVLYCDDATKPRCASERMRVEWSRPAFSQSHRSKRLERRWKSEQSEHSTTLENLTLLPTQALNYLTKHTDLSVREQSSAFSTINRWRWLEAMKSIHFHVP